MCAQEGYYAEKFKCFIKLYCLNIIASKYYSIYPSKQEHTSIYLYDTLYDPITQFI